MTNREVMQQALEALKGLFGNSEKWESGGVAVWRLGGSGAPRKAITALEAALEQPVQKPVLQEIAQYRMQMGGISRAAFGYWKEGDGIYPDYDTVALRDVAKLYAKYDDLYKAAALEQPVQKPVAVAYLCENGVGHRYFRWKKPSDIYKPIALYTTPPAAQRPWQGLTEFQFAEIYNKWNDTNGSTPWGLNQALEAKLRKLNT